MKKTILILLLVLLAGCATPQNEVHPVDYSGVSSGTVRPNRPYYLEFFNGTFTQTPVNE